MKSYIRESENMGKGRRWITYYTPSEYFLLSAIKLMFFICLIWPIQIVIFIIVKIFCYLAIALLWIISKIANAIIAHFHKE